MANVTIDQLPLPPTVLDGTEEIPAWKDGETIKITAQDVADLAPAPSSTGIDVQTFNSSGTWTKPANAKLVEIFCRGGGGGGGAGGSVLTNVINSPGGSGGGGAAQSSRRLLAADLGATESVTVGAGGIGGTGVASGVGGSGTDGGDSIFGASNLCLAQKGIKGNGGRSGSNTGGTGGAGYNIGGTTSLTGHGTQGGDSNNNAVGGVGVDVITQDAGFQCTGGGAGGSVDVISSVEFAGGKGGSLMFYGTAGGTAGAVHANGGNGSAFGGTMGVGTGAGGGGGSSTGGTPGGNGGLGVNGGGGGGGGAGVTSSTVSGNGGNGGAGVVVVVTYF